jgi:hypothetical protein
MNDIRMRPLRLTIASFALLATAGCGDSSGPGEPEDPGILLVPSGYHSGDVVRTRDGTELAYVVRTALNGANVDLLKAVTVSTQIVRQLNESSTILQLVRSSPGERIYFGTAISPPSGSVDNFRVSRIHPASGLQEVVATSRAGDLAVSADERFVASGTRLHDLQTGAQIALPDRGNPIDFSPDGTQLLYSTGFYSSTLISTADGSSRPLYSTDDFYLAHRWEGNSPQLLKADISDNSTVRLSEIDGVTGAARSIAQIDGLFIFQSANWSPDGRVLGIWIQRGTKFDGTDRQYLYVVRSGNAPAVVANVRGVPSRPVFSPSGSSIAYFYRGETQQLSLYLKSGI